MHYFDAAATTLQKPPEVARALARAARTLSSPGRGGYAPAREADRTLFDCRVQAAALFDCDPTQVVFTMNATHGLNLAIKSLVAPGARVVISGFEHNAVVRPLYACAARIVVAGRKLFDPADTLAAFDRALTPDTAAAVVTQVSNVFGYILPLERIAALCRARHIPLIVDASQGAGCLPLSLRALGAAFIAMPGHKGLYGPQGTGLLLCADPGRPLLEGGTGIESRLRTMPEALPERLEAGTPNVCGIAGLLAGLHFVRDNGPAEILAHEQQLLRRLTRQLAGHPALQCFTQEAALPCLAGEPDARGFAEEAGPKCFAGESAPQCFAGEPALRCFTGESAPQCFAGKPALQCFTGESAPQCVAGKPIPPCFAGKAAPQHFTGGSASRRFAGESAPQCVAEESARQHFAGESAPQCVAGKSAPQCFAGEPAPRCFTGEPASQCLAGKSAPQCFVGEANQQRFAGETIPQCVAGGSVLPCFAGGGDQSGVLSLRIRGLDAEDVAELLAERGYAVRAGLHCAPLAHESADTLATGTIRISFSAFTTAPETDSLAHTLLTLPNLAEN